MLLAQISDAHRGTMLRKGTFRTAVKEINEMKRDVVPVAGDLTEKGFI